MVKAAPKKDNVTNINSKKPAKGKEPNELYDALTPANQDKWDEIGKMGWRPDKVKSGYIATKIHGEGRVGPFDSLAVLYSEVKQEVETNPAKAEDAKADVEMVDENSKGRLLPTMEIPSVKKLDELIKRRCAAVKVFTEASAKVQEINNECLDAFESHKQHFVLNGEKKKHIYKSPAGGELRIKHEVTDKVESALAEDDE